MDEGVYLRQGTLCGRLSVEEVQETGNTLA